MKDGKCCPGQNALLAALPDPALQRLWTHLDRVYLNRGEVLRAPGPGARHAYFPITAQVSAFYLLASGVSAEFALIGCDGMVGVEGYLGGGGSASTTQVINSGWAWRVHDELLARLFEQDSTVRFLLLRYAQVLITQIGQSVACNRHHTIEQQLFRFLLASLDRSGSNDLAMTHELLGSRLGVRRESVSAAACRAQETGLIRYQRGQITVLNRASIEARTCECYAIVRRESARLLPVKPYGSGCSLQACRTCNTGHPDLQRPPERPRAVQQAKPMTESV